MPVIGRCCTRVFPRCRPQRLMPDLFSAVGAVFAEELRNEAIAPGAVLLHGFLPFVEGILRAITDIVAQAREHQDLWGSHAATA